MLTNEGLFTPFCGQDNNEAFFLEITTYIPIYCNKSQSKTSPFFKAKSRRRKYERIFHIQSDSFSFLSTNDFSIYSQTFLLLFTKKSCDFHLKFFSSIYLFNNKSLDLVMFYYVVSFSHIPVRFCETTVTGKSHLCILYVVGILFCTSQTLFCLAPCIILLNQTEW